jgi:hypothetical protein
MSIEGSDCPRWPVPRHVVLIQSSRVQKSTRFFGFPANFMLCRPSGTHLLYARSHFRPPIPSTYFCFGLSSCVYSVPIDLCMYLNSADVLFFFPATRDGDMSNEIAFRMPVPPAHDNRESS